MIQSLVAVYSGHWFGVGLGNSKEKLFYLPEAHNDFIFAVICEELGLFGALLTVTAPSEAPREVALPRAA